MGKMLQATAYIEECTVLCIGSFFLLQPEKFKLEIDYIFRVVNSIFQTRECQKSSADRQEDHHLPFSNIW